MAIAEIELVDVAPAEEAEIAQIFQEYLRELAALDGRNIPAGMPFDYPSWENYWDGTPGRTAFWIIIGGGKVGFALFRNLGPGEWPTVPPPIHLAEFCVFRPFRGRQIGSSVMNFLLQDFRQRGEILVWNCKQNNRRAEKFYDRLLADFSRQTDRDWTYEKSEYVTEIETMWRYVCGPI
jgi:predicted acetyltransferase